ncbi:ankyrin repeat-containing protein At5g02620-like [Pyrus x bretschneideri]|uniref:ankyrin repeat-containing protein At5g02620-like n=1 Tax=Pyrus x bretschneideri TaxID=225117 RepID=UPI00203042BD|nr:ankyrin repeat-containing protein At5g02620-like [Pyrus x bretschneideri]
MDTSNLADQSESSIIPLASTDVGNQIELADQTDVQEAVKLEGNNSTVLISSMNPDVFNAAKQGNLDVLKEQGKNLDKMLTATKNTVLHIYTACCMQPPYRESEDEILKSTTTVDGILEMCPALLWKQNESGDTALHIAARYGRAGILRALIQATKTYYQGDLEQGCAISSEDAPLHVVARYGPAGKLRALIQATKSYYQGDLEQGCAISSEDAPLHAVARYGLAGILRALIQATYHPGDLEQGCAISSKDAPSQDQKLIRKTNNKKDTALHEAVRFNHFAVVEILIKADPEFSYSANDAGETPLYLAVERGYDHYCRQILEGCKNPTYEGPNGRTALHAAVIRNDEVMTTALLKSDRNLAKAADELGHIPLHMAANFGHFSMVQQLLECDKSIAYIADNGGRTALHFAASEGHLDIMRELLTHCPDCCELVDNQCQNVLHYAIKSHQDDIVDFVLKDLWLSNILLNDKDANGNAPIHYLAQYPFLWKDAIILDAKIDIMSFNKKNLNAFDTILANEDSISNALELKDLKIKLQRRDGRPGHRIKSHNADGKDTGESLTKAKETHLKLQRKDGRPGHRIKSHNVDGKDTGESLTKAKETHLVVATLIATVTFAAGFTMPGGYHSERGSDQGSPILLRNTAFKAFVITDTLAMALSICSVLMLLYSSIQPKYMTQTSDTFRSVVNFTMSALIAMVIAFVTGTYAVLGGHYPGLAIAAVVLGCFFFYYALISLFMERNTEGTGFLPAPFVFI